MQRIVISLDWKPVAVHRVLLCIALCLGSMACTASEVQVQPPEGNRDSTISFASVTPGKVSDFVDRTAGRKITISGQLAFPEAHTSPVPAVVILHGSGGISPREMVWARRLNEMGVASFVVDSFSGRNIKSTVADQTRLSMSAGIADAYAALRLLAADPRIDGRKIAVMGFSRGGIAALYSALEPFRHAAIDDDLRFAAHIAFYPGCTIPYTSAHLDGAPILMLLGGKDNYTPAAPCSAYASTLRDRGAQITVKIYPDGYHDFDRPMPLHAVPSATSTRACRGSHDLDTRQFIMLRGDKTVSGAEAIAETKSCLSRGVLLGGDALAQEQSPLDVAAFLGSVFGDGRAGLQTTGRGLQY